MLENKKIRIANGQGFWGDSSQAPIDLVNSGNIDYLTMDYLAEVTMSIMQKQKNKNPKAGYARDFIDFLKTSLGTIKKNKIKVISFDELTVKLCKKHNASIIIRGLRAVSDFEYEFQLAGMNKKLDKSIETIFLMSDIENEIISSKFIKEIAQLNGDLRKFVSKSVIKTIKKKIG